MFVLTGFLVVMGIDERDHLILLRALQVLMVAGLIPIWIKYYRAVNSDLLLSDRLKRRFSAIFWIGIAPLEILLYASSDWYRRRLEEEDAA